MSLYLFVSLINYHELHIIIQSFKIRLHEWSRQEFSL